MAFSLKTYLKNRQDAYMLGVYWAAEVVYIFYADKSSLTTPLPRNSSPKNKETKNTWYKIKNHLCQTSLND